MSSSSLRQAEHSREGSHLVLAPGPGSGRLKHPITSQLFDHVEVTLKRPPIATLEIKALERLPRTLATAVRRLGRVANQLYPQANQVVGDAEHLLCLSRVESIDPGAQAEVDGHQHCLTYRQPRLHGGNDGQRAPGRPHGG